jgi:glycosyltransferase involved in cell wall biosynthesis
MAVIEAMALGLPVVAGLNSGGVPWVLDEGRAGFLTDVRKPEKILQTLLACVERPEDRERRQRIAYSRVLNVFSPDSVANRYERMYDRILSSHRSVCNHSLSDYAIH